ncbi:histidine kinase-like protein [Streptomyces sp. TLI_185]|nr:histidine kinase-like protein [Streptomyces sp. TLI_185]
MADRGKRPGRPWGAPRGSCAEINQLVALVRSWLDETSVSVGQLHRQLTPDHFVAKVVPELRRLRDLLAGEALEWDLVEAVADVCFPHEPADRTGQRLQTARELWDQAQVSPRPIEETQELALARELLAAKDRTIEVYQEMQRVRQAYEASERGWHQALQIVTLLFAMLGQAQAKVAELKRRVDALQLLPAKDLGEHKALELRLSRAQWQQTELREQLSRAEQERDTAQQVADHASRRMQALETELAELRVRMGHDHAAQPQDLTPQTPLPDLDAIRPDDAALDDVDRALEKVRAVLDEEHEAVQQAADEVGYRTPPPRHSDADGTMVSIVPGQVQRARAADLPSAGEDREVLGVVRDNRDNPSASSKTSRRSGLKWLRRALRPYERDGVAEPRQGQDRLGPKSDKQSVGADSGRIGEASSQRDSHDAQRDPGRQLEASERRHRETAVILQRSLLPQELEEPDDLRIAATYQPAGSEAAVGGDWYDVITLGGGRTALVIGDVMGRGVRAAAVMGQLRTAVRAYARLDLPPHEILQLLDGLTTELDANQIATCVYAVHDPNEGRLVYASAGHLPILVRDEGGSVVRADEPTGPPLGVGGWVYASGAIPLGPGFTAVLYTDGLVERRDQDIDDGIAALEQALSVASGPSQAVCDWLLRGLGVTADHDDDVAVLVLQQPDRTGPDGELFRNAALELLGGVEVAPRARAFASGVLTSWRFSPELHDRGVLAASELVANALQHGAPPMRLRLRRTDRRLIVEVIDGNDHLPRRRRAEPQDESGRGISVIATIASNWGSRRTPGGGKAVWCEFTLDG